MQNLKDAIAEIMPLIYSTEIRDAYTQGHSEHVAYYAKSLASAMGLSKDDCNDIYLAGLLHDIGKIGIPDSILLKPGRLETEEYHLIKLHSHISGQIIDKLQHFSYLKDAVRHHHEDFNGRGYPDGLAGEDIPLFARILSIVDVFDALTTGRIYRAAIPFDEAMKIIENMQIQTKFDPEIYNIFVPFIKKLGIIKDTHARDIEFKELEDKRNSFFFTDHLTKLLNREALLAYLRKSHDYDYKVSMVLFNIKNFRHYNKKFGLVKGDNLLKNISQILIEYLSAKTTIKEPQNKDLFLFRANSDKFVILNIGQRSEFLSYKLDKLQTIIKDRFDTETESKYILKNSNVIRNINEEIGYLL